MLVNERELKITFNNSEWKYIKLIIEKRMEIVSNKPITADIRNFVPEGYVIINTLVMWDWFEYILYFNELEQRIIAVRKEVKTHDPNSNDKYVSIS